MAAFPAEVSAHAYATAVLPVRVPSMAASEAPAIASSRQMAAQLCAARRGAAEAARAAPQAVRWVLQSPHAAPDGTRISYTSELRSTRCMASMYASYFVSLLEEAVLSRVLDSTAAEDCGQMGARDMESQSGCAQQGTADAQGPGPHYFHIIATLDTALHGAHNLADSQLQLRCGLDSRTPVAAAVPHIVRSICQSTRAFVPRPLWLQGCALFVEFMAGLTRGHPLAAGVCPHKERGPDGEEVHTVNTCPRCCVFAHMFAALREEVVSALEGKAWPVETAPLATLRPRWAELYGFCVLSTMQCMTDRPVAFRQMLVTLCSGNSSAMIKEHQVLLDMFRQLRMSPGQQEQAAKAWRVWVATRTALDRQLAAALEPLCALIHSSDLFKARCVHAAQPSMRSVNSILPSGTLPPPGTEDAHAPSRSARIGHAAGAAERSGGVRICGGCAANVSQRLLGGSAHSMAAAQRALRAVAEVHRREGEIAVEQLRAICMPGVIFTPEQYAQTAGLMLRASALTDWVGLCKLAAQEMQQSAAWEGLHSLCGEI